MFRLICQVSVILVFKKKNTFKYFLNPERKQVCLHERSVKEVPKKESLVFIRDNEEGQAYSKNSR